MIRPFLRIPGGKGRLVKPYLELFPSKVHSAVFPTVGGGAVELALLADPGRVFVGTVTIADKSTDIILAWRTVRDHVKHLFPILEEHTKLHSSDHFYETRAGYSAMNAGVEKAAAFMYMNKVNYNGLTRVNRKGEPNAPLGKDGKKRLLKGKFDLENLLMVSGLLQGVEIVCGDFAETCKRAYPESFVFIDPPYLHATDEKKSFTGYTAGGFTAADHLRLAMTFQDLHDNGAKVALCGADTPLYRDVYRKFCIHEMTVRRDVGCTPASRGDVREILVTNFDGKKDQE